MRFFAMVNLALVGLYERRLWNCSTGNAIIGFAAVAASIAEPMPAAPRLRYNAVLENTP
jgi:hypothetical protein